jgi:hypothetical protein
MTDDPRHPKQPPKRRQAGAPRPVPGPVPKRPPVLTWSPFGPTDLTSLDAPAVQAGAEALRARLEGTRATLEKIRRGGAPPEPPDDRHPPVATVPRRADQLLPFLLIRTFPGDIGARPLDPTAAHQSPDIVVTTPAVDDLVVVDRKAFAATLKNRIPTDYFGEPWTAMFDVWVHVWNLGLASAFGVRVRAWAVEPGKGYRRFIGGRRIDLGDRTSTTSHLMVKMGTWRKDESENLMAIAESITDVANGTRDWSQDRHVAVRDMWTS